MVLAGDFDLELMRADPVKFSDTHYRRSLSAGLHRDPFSDPHVNLTIFAVGAVKLTPGEARQVGAELERLANIARLSLRVPLLRESAPSLLLTQRGGAHSCAR